MSDPLSIILSFLNARLLAIFPIAVGALIFFFLPDVALQQMKINDLGNAWRTSVLLVDLILWAYLISKLGIFLFGALENWLARRSEKKTALAYLGSGNSMKMGEIVILVEQKRKNERQFITESDDTFLCALYGKGLIAKVKWIKGIGQEYRIPDFVWRSNRLQELTDKHASQLGKILKR